MTKRQLKRLRNLLTQYSEWENELIDGQMRDYMGELIHNIDKQLGDA